MKDLSVLIPSTFFATLPVAGLQYTAGASYVQLNTMQAGQGSGFLPRYQNTQPDNPTTGWNGDQGHHFAAFFEYGYQYGASAGITASNLYEFFQGLANGGTNEGDIQLGDLAAAMGAQLKSGVLSRADVGGMIASTLCKN